MRDMIFDIEVEPRGETYRALLRVGSEYCDVVGFVIRPREALHESVAELLRVLTPALMSDEMTNEWPGTELLGLDDQARLIRYAINDITLAHVMNACDRLYAWEHPKLPEDLFLERTAVPWLTSVAHERAAFLTMTSDEAKALRSRLPRLVFTRR
jgi:hypothetical protein